MQRAHRVAWELYRGPLSPDEHVLHSCDMTCCVNPDHLFLGDQQINVADKVRKGRQNRGENHGRAKLTESAVLLIRRDARLYSDIASAHGVSVQTVCDIKQRRSWSHL